MRAELLLAVDNTGLPNEFLVGQFAEKIVNIEKNDNKLKINNEVELTIVSYTLVKNLVVVDSTKAFLVFSLLKD